jgi:hypothetical protein
MHPAAGPMMPFFLRSAAIRQHALQARRTRLSCDQQATKNLPAAHPNFRPEPSL